jgi:hypothetical protein
LPRTADERSVEGSISPERVTTSRATPKNH